MSVSNPEPGDVFWDVPRCARLVYVGRSSEQHMVMENVDQESDVPAFLTISTDYARDSLAPWQDEITELKIGQTWDRTRNDFLDRRAHILGIVDYRGTDQIIYEEIGGSGPNPKMKKEIDFRRVYGRLFDDGDNSDACSNCPHRMSVHDREGCTVTIPQTEDPDFGPTQTCPCCRKGPRCD